VDGIRHYWATEAGNVKGGPLPLLVVFCPALSCPALSSLTKKPPFTELSYRP
jgi:hypothetical protein